MYVCIESEDALNWGESSVIFIMLFIIVIMSGRIIMIIIIIIIIKFMCVFSCGHFCTSVFVV